MISLDAPSLTVTSSVEQRAWSGQTRNFTCAASALPAPSLAWQRSGGQNLTYLSTTGAAQYVVMTTKSSNVADSEQTITSTLQVWVKIITIFSQLCQRLKPCLYCTFLNQNSTGAWRLDSSFCHQQRLRCWRQRKRYFALSSLLKLKGISFVMQSPGYTPRIVCY